MVSLIVRLLLVLAVAAVPTLVVQIGGEVVARRSETAELASRAQRIATRLAASQRAFLDNTDVMLGLFGSLPAVSENQPDCPTTLAAIAVRSPGLDRLVLADPSGAVVCGTDPGRAAFGRNVADNAAFRAAAAARFAVSQVMPPEAARPEIVIACRVTRADGAPPLFFLALIDPNWLASQLAQGRLRDRGAVGIVDEDGHLLIRAPEAAGEVGRTLAWAKQLGAPTAPGLADGRDVNGDRRLIGYAPFEVMPGRRWLVAVTFSRTEISAAAWRETRGMLLLLAIEVALGMLIVWLLGRRVIERPIAALLRGAESWSGGALRERVSLPPGGEFGRLAAAFNTMAEEIGFRQARLAESEAFVRSVVENSADCIMALDPTGRLVFVNQPGVRAMEAGDAGALRGRRWRELFPDEVRPAIDRALGAALSGRVGRVEAWCPTLLGAIRWWDIRATAVRDAAGAVERLVVIARNITPAKRAAAASRENEAKYRLIADAVPHLVWIASPAAGAALPNARCAEFFGAPPPDPVHGDLAFVHPADRPSAMAARALGFATGQGFQAEYRLARRDGAWLWHDLRANPVRGEGGLVTAWVVTAADVDELRRMNERLETRVGERTRALEAARHEREQAEAALFQSQKLEAVGQMTGGLAHDFNNLLTVIVGNLDMIQEACERAEPEGSRIARLAGRAMHAAERGARLTAQLLAFARRQMLRPATLAVGTLIEETGDLLRRAAGEAVSVSVVIAPDLWPCRIDAAQFESALLNLALNARDAMLQGGTLEVRLDNAALDPGTARELDVPAGDYVRVVVEDTGIGMSESVRERVFEPFFTTKDAGAGSGLGLPQVYGFTRQSGGTVQIDSVPGKGTRVTLYFPRASDEFAPAAAGHVPLARLRGQGTVLIAEDVSEVREVFTDTLAGAGYDVLAVANGAATLAILRSGRSVDLLLADLVLPGGIDGRSLAREARRVLPRLSVLLTSGTVPQEGGDEFPMLAKPARPAELLERVGALLASSAETPPLVRQ